MGFGELLSGNGLDTLSMPVGGVFSYEGDPFDSSYSVLSNTLLEDVVFYIHDHLGNTRVTYQAEKNGGTVDYTLKGAFDYYPYGKTLRTFNPQEEKYLSTHHERDQETGFDYRGARFYDSDVARFLSLDPHATDYPSLSDYVYVADNPLFFVDPDGRDNVIYLVVLPSSYFDNGGNFSKEMVKELIDNANQEYTAMGLETRVALFESDETFNMGKMDATDAVAVMGGKDKVVDYISNNLDSEFGKELCNWSGEVDHPEISENNFNTGGNVIAISSMGVENADKGAFIVMHGAGHNSGEGHKPFPYKKQFGNISNSNIMLDGNSMELKRRAGSKSHLENAKGENKSYKKAIETRFGTNKSKNNYEY